MSLIEDVRYGLRALTRSRAFTAITVTTLALGIGANTALFSVVNAVLLRPLPYDHPEHIAVVWRTTPQAVENPHAAADFLDLEHDNRTLEAVAGVRGASLDMALGAGEPVRLQGAEVTSAFFDVFGVPAAIGRALRAREDRPGDRRAVLSHGAWVRVFGSDPAVVGRTVRFGSVPTTVIGVMPRGFDWPRGTEAWTLADRRVPSSPVVVEGDIEAKRGLSYFDVVARLRTGTTLVAAQADLDGIGRRLADAFPDNNKDRGYKLVPIHSQLTGALRPTLLTLLGVVGLVLLIASANVASLLLARGLDRRRELAVRASMGASPARLVRQLLAESVLLALLGAVLGLVLADQGTRLVLRLLPSDLPRAGDVAVDGTVLLFTLAVAIATGLLFGTAPALEAARVEPLEALHAGGRSATAKSARLRSVLVGAEIAVALVVLSGAGLLLRSFVRLQDVDPGFLTETVVTTPLPLPASRYPAARDQARFYGEAVARLRAAGGYRVAAGFPLPFGDGTSSAAPMRPEKRPASDADAMTLLATVTPSYFEVLGIPLRAGRTFTEADEKGKPGVVVISQAAAARFWPGQDPLGQRVTLGSDDLFTVVGVVGDVRRKGLGMPAEPTVYLSYRQFALPLFHLFARGVEAGRMAGDLRAVVRELDPELPLETPRGLAELRATSVSAPRFRAVFLGLFAALGLTLTAVGLYGLVSDSASRRAREIGIRMALGAERSEVVRLVLRDGLRLSLWGGAVGLLASLALGRVIASFLYGVTATDPLTLSLVMLLLLAMSLLATYVPARRASRLDPVAAIRSE